MYVYIRNKERRLLQKIENQEEKGITTTVP